MIDRIILENFQAHAKLDLRLEPVTTLVGSSDVGKSAVLRALRWVAENRPAGASFVRDGASSAAVSVRAEGRWVVRKRSERENVYEFDGEMYQSLRAVSVPDSIAAHLNTGPVNFQSQHDAPYWLTDSAGEVSRHLNAVINLGEIDEILGRAAASVREIRAREKLIGERLAAAETVVRNTEWAADADTALTQLEERHADWRESRDAADGLRAAVAELRDAERELASRAEFADAGAAVVAAGRAALAAADERAALAEILTDLRRNESRCGDDPTDDWENLKRIRADGDAVAESTRNLRYLRDELRTATAGEQRWQNEYQTARDELAAATDGRCPLCNQPAEPSQFLSPTFICPTEPPSHVGREPVRRGTRPRPASSGN